MSIAILAGVIVFATGSAVKADFEVQFSYNGNTLTIDNTTQTYSDNYGKTYSTSNGTGGATINFNWDGFEYAPGSLDISGVIISSNGSAPGFKVSATMADSNSPGANNTASIDLSSLSIQNSTGVAGNSTLTVTTGDTGFTQPAGAPYVTMTSTISVTAAGANTGTSNSIAFNSYLDTTNTQFGKQQGTPTITSGSITNGTSFVGNSVASLTGTPTPYSVTQVAVVTLTNGDKFTDGSSGTTVWAPAPSSWLMALSAFPVFAFIKLRARRQRMPL